jgi:hypothetical protein
VIRDEDMQNQYAFSLSYANKQMDGDFGCHQLGSALGVERLWLFIPILWVGCN